MDPMVMVACPSCGTSVAFDEKFCTSCGAGLATGPMGAVIQDQPVVKIDLGRSHLGTARKWLLAISLITLVSGFIFYGIQKTETENQIREAKTAVIGVDPVERDARMKAKIGMTFDEAIAHDRGMVTMLLVVNIALSVIYFGLWFWAKSNPYVAALIALLLFLTVIVISAVLEPTSLAQGVVVKILFIAALGKAVMAGREERRILGAG